MSDDIGLHIGDVRVLIELPVYNEDGTAADISEATVKQFKLTKPSGATVTVNVSFTTDGSDGLLRYTTSDEIDQYGSWRIRAYLEFGGGWAGHTSHRVFSVFAV